MVRFYATVDESFHHAAGDVRARRIEHRVVVGEGNVTQKLPVIVNIESRPAAIFALHGEEPIHRALFARILFCLIAAARFLEGEQHHGGIVYVGIKFVIKFERPAGGFHVGPFDGPIAFTPDFFRNHPIGRTAQSVQRRIFSFAQSVGGDGCIPNGRKARLHVEARFFVVHHQLLELGFGLHA